MNPNWKDEVVGVILRAMLGTVMGIAIAYAWIPNAEAGEWATYGVEGVYGSSYELQRGTVLSVIFDDPTCETVHLTVIGGGMSDTLTITTLDGYSEDADVTNELTPDGVEFGHTHLTTDSLLGMVEAYPMFDVTFAGHTYEQRGVNTVVALEEAYQECMKVGRLGLFSSGQVVRF
ncbi:MAG: hypothetical protein HC888_00980 [Candidatus Competibacteraceae bacterium]|nr:hypothetical protein [Candidatus Competibacteraceae bacterium]